jgi:hypothetical protein
MANVVARDVNEYNKSMKEEDSILLEYAEIRRGPGQSRAVSLVCDAAIQSEDERSKATLAPSSSDASEFA